MKIFSSSKQKLSGFSIGEVLVASFLLTVGIITVLALISYSYRNSGETQVLIVASELAQEGVELVRNVRDNAIATGATGDAIFNNFPSNGKCNIDYSVTTFSCGGNPNYQLYLNGSNLYQHSSTGATATRYHRALRIDHQNNSGQARIQSFVAWETPGTGSTPSFNPANINLNQCTPANKCVYTELYLTAWK